MQTAIYSSKYTSSFVANPLANALRITVVAAPKQTGYSLGYSSELALLSTKSSHASLTLLIRIL
jgi:hypothetical protein